jgi:phosphosulfolactate synthase
MPESSDESSLAPLTLDPAPSAGRAAAAAAGWMPELDGWVPQRKRTKPRASGRTMVLDRSMGLSALHDLLAMAGLHVDEVKLAFGSSLVLDESFLQQKIDLARHFGVSIHPGGTLTEIALLQRRFRPFVQRVKAMGFTAIEVSDGSISLSRRARDAAICYALDAGLRVVSEVGKKAPGLPIEPALLAEEIGRDLALGVDQVVVEGRERGLGVGVYDGQGGLRAADAEDIAGRLGDAAVRVMWEAPLHAQHVALVTLFGPNVSLGNIHPDDVLALESLRRGLRFETLGHFGPASLSVDAL